MDEIILKFSEARSIKELNNLYNSYKDTISANDKDKFEEVYKMSKENMLQGKTEYKQEESAIDQDLLKQAQIPRIQDLYDLKYPLLVKDSNINGNTLEFSKREKSVIIYDGI